MFPKLRQQRNRVVTLLAVATATVALMAAPASAASIGPKTTCGQYFKHNAAERYDAAIRLSRKFHLSSPGNPMWALTFDSACGASSNSTQLRNVFAR